MADEKPATAPASADSSHQSEHPPVASTRWSTSTSTPVPGSNSVDDDDTPDRDPHEFARIRTGVSVEQATADFAELQRELSRISRASHHQHSHSHGHNAPGDIEKAGHGKGDSADGPNSGSTSSEELFDLETVLRSGLSAEREAGIRPKHIGVTWDGLRVTGMGGFSNFVRTFPDAFVEFFDVVSPIVHSVRGALQAKASSAASAAGTLRPNEVCILDGFRGVCKPGEMVLVLGKPGSGCTTFLKTITNNRLGYSSVTGDVRYGPFTAAEFDRRYRGEAVYNQEDDIHHATLTVEQTLRFGLDMKLPGKRPAGLLSPSVFKEHVITTLLRMFNIEHTRHTVIGDQFIRGVSGGERKRVSLAEMMLTNACILSWDNSTRGLDASTALDFAKSLRIQTDLYRTSTFVSLYQASENIYRLFDKVLVIDGGRQVYFGPASEARAYFEGLGFQPRPRQTTPDYLTGCTDEYEREYAPGFSPENAPHDPASFAEVFNRSKIAAAVDAEMKTFTSTIESEASPRDDFVTAVHESKRASSRRSVYSAGFHIQVAGLARRQFLLKLQDRVKLAVSWLRSIVIAIALGTMNFGLSNSSGDAFNKGGVLFVSLLFNAFQAFSELASTMVGRGVVNKHKMFAFHRPSALWIAQILVDQAFAATEIMVFSIMVYFMTDLLRTAGAFFTFYLLILCGNIAMTIIFRIVGCASKSFDVAIKFTVLLVTLYVITSGYLIQYQSEKVWLRWIFWVNPLGLAFASMMQNEFGDVTLVCSGQTLVPSGPGYGDINHQVCTLPGSVAGTTAVSGASYIAQSFAIYAGDLWRNFGIVMALIVFFLFMNLVVGELVNYGMGGNTARVFQKPNDERRALNKELARKRVERRKDKSDESGAELKIASESVLTWESINYDVPTPGGTLRLLKNITGYVRPGELTALMGASGAGKTTLLDVLAARKNVGVITGDVLVDGLRPGVEFQRSTSYAEQLDMHDPSQTVREALRFSADLRQPFETPRDEKYAYVEEIMALLEMEDIADCIIGTPEFGLTVEQRKRVTIGVELAAKPELLLFLDEPTSGLDSQSAFNIVRFLKKLASAGQAILCTIHQPNAALFENFDRLLLLQRGGRTVYFGDIGKDAAILRGYLKKHGAVAAPTDNVAEFMLEAVGAGSAPRVGNRDWADIWEESEELAAVKATIAQMKQERLGANAASRSEVTHESGKSGAKAELEYASPFTHQLSVVLQRMNLSFWRSPDYLFTRLFNHIAVALFTGLAYLNLDDSRSSLQYKVFIMFQVTVLPALIVGQVEIMYHIKRAIFFRESLSKMYSPVVFATSIVIAEIPYSTLCAVCFYLPLYFIPGFQSEPSRAGYQFFMILITEFFSVTLGQGLAALTPSAFVSSQFDPFIFITLALFCGVVTPPAQMPAFWRAWLYQLDPFTRLIGGMVTTALHELPVRCATNELNSFFTVNGTTCGEYMASFFENGGPGYIVDPSSVDRCDYCAFSVGDEFYAPMGFSFDHRWRDLGIFAAFVGSNLIILFLASRFLNYNRR